MTRLSRMYAVGFRTNPTGDLWVNSDAMSFPRQLGLTVGTIPVMEHLGQNYHENNPLRSLTS